MPVFARIFLILLLAAAVHADDTDDQHEPEIRDPFFEFCVSVVEGDSIGVWTRDHIVEWMAATGRETRLPIDMVVSVERRAADAPKIRYQYQARYEFILTLTDDLAVPLPYSILGYHPGTLHVSRTVLAREWDLRSPVIRFHDDGTDYELHCSSVRTLQVLDGWVVLDADGWLDRLLGKKLDDTWVEAFVLARTNGAPDPDEDGLQGLALGRARKGRALAGAFDFARDKVLPNGLPVARALSGVARPVAAPWEEPVDSRAWSWPRGR